MNFDRLAGFASAVGILLILTMIAWLGIGGPIWEATWKATPDQWLGAVASVIGSIFTGAIAAAAIYFAWRGIMSQLRIGVFSREEDRIERELLGLQNARMLLEKVERFFRSPLDSAVVFKGLTDMGFGATDSQYEVEIKEILPITLEATRVMVARLIWYLRTNARRHSLVKSGQTTEVFGEEGAQKVMARWMDEVTAFRTKLQLREDHLRKRLLRCRRVIETFFDEPADQN